VSAVSDGEIPALTDDEKLDAHERLFRRGEPRFAAFALLWHDRQVSGYAPLIGANKNLLRFRLSFLGNEFRLYGGSFQGWL
jgi:hypothetical protein